MKTTAILLPTDNRPITYLYPQNICHLAGLNVLVPPRDLMGSLFAPTNLSELNNWLDDAINKVSAGVILLCIDTLLYGGLIPSRRSEDTLATILARLDYVGGLKKRCGGKIKIYAQSSIMRISNNYDNTEEKLYWSQLGQEIFNWSKLLHQKELGILSSNDELETVTSKIPSEIQEDYLATRKRNFLVNQKAIDYVVSGDLDFLIFSQDDSGEYGFNVSEKNQLIALAKEKGTRNVLAYPGADEMLMTLIGRYLNDQRQHSSQIAMFYSASNGAELYSNFEGQNIGKSMQNQTAAQSLEVNDVEITHGGTDFNVIVHTGSDKQGDHMWLPGLPDLRFVDTKVSAAKAIQLIKQSQSPVVICDIAYSNGADPVLIDFLLANPELFSKIWAYGGWNTTGNAVGSALAIGTACLHAANSEGLDDFERKKLLFLRLMDDWAYQTQVRKILSAVEVNTAEQQKKLKELMDQCSAKLAKNLEFVPEKLQYNLPWQRAFEIEIGLNDHLATV
jgi:hypothetical protein